MTVPLWAWAGTLAIFAVLIAADLLVTRGTGGTGLRRAAVLSGLWIAAGLAFGGALWLWQGSDIAGQYFGGYLLEKALSVDNTLVFVLLFASLAVPVPLQRRVLYLGVARDLPGSATQTRRCSRRQISFGAGLKQPRRQKSTAQCAPIANHGLRVGRHAVTNTTPPPAAPASASNAWIPRMHQHRDTGR